MLKKEFDQWNVDPFQDVEFILVIRGSKKLVASRLHEFAKYVRRGIAFREETKCLDVGGIKTATCCASMIPLISIESHDTN